ncbi:unnamed protein product, partial [Closterium sp. NIES-53]
DHFLSLDPTSLTVDLLEQHLLAAETSAVAVGAARGTPRPPLFKGCSPSPLAPSFASAAAADVFVAEDVGATSTSAKRRSRKGKGGRGGGGGSGGGGGGSGSGGGGGGGGGGGSGGGGGGGTSGGSGGSGNGGGGSGGSGGSGGGGTGGGRPRPWRGGPGGGPRQQQQRRSGTQSPKQLQAITGHYSSQWQAAMDAEMASWKSTGTYVNEVPPSRANIVDGMWIFRVKRPSGSPPAFKARYVARGFSQQQGVDYFQTFSPTPKMTNLRVLLHVAAQRDYVLNSLDFSTAFLQGSLHEETWLFRPPGFTGSFPARTQWSLRRPVYGLRQAPREWHDTLRTTLAALGFTPSTADPSLFLRTNTSLPLFYVLVYVDDLVFATADTEALTLVNLELQKRHTCTDLGELRSYLGLQITRDRARRTITLTQSYMVHQVLQRFGFQFSSPQPTPLSTSHSLSAPPSDESVEPSGPYPELVGCLMYLMTCTRPDLVYPLSLKAPYVAPCRHQKVHWDAAKRVLRYLCSTSGMGLVLGGRGPVVLTGHADASWVDDSATQRSSQGYTFSLGSGSSYEAEIYAGAMAAQELR